MVPVRLVILSTVAGLQLRQYTGPFDEERNFSPLALSCDLKKRSLITKRSHSKVVF